MNFYNYIFYSIYKPIEKVNKLSPEIPAVIFLSVLQFVNIYSVILVLNLLPNTIELNWFYIALALILLFNYFYFLRNEKWEKIINYYATRKNNKILDFLVFVYPFLSFYIVFKLLEFNDTTIFIFLTILLIIELYHYFDLDKI